MEFKADIPKLTKTQLALQRFVAASKDLRPPLLAYGQHMKRIAGRSVQEQADPESGAPWPKLQKSTLDARVGGGKDGKALAGTGRLIQSLTAATPVVKRLSVSIASNLPYAAIHQTGGVIKPRFAKMLAQPLTREAARAKFARRWWKQMERRKTRKPFVHKAESGKLYLAIPSRDGKDIEVHWALHKSVTIPARPYLGHGERDIKVLIGLMQGHLGEPLDRL